MKFSLIVPTFGRPEEVTEFLLSLVRQEYRDFEVIISDGTPNNALIPYIKAIENKLNFEWNFFQRDFLPVSDARNEGAKLAIGDYYIFLDSDCIIPPDFLKILLPAIQKRDLDFFGGPDMEHSEFTKLQKSISFSMTSWLTTGGIRGGRKHVGKFLPRGFNMGMKQSVFEALGGYNINIKCAEDIDLSLRALSSGFNVGLIHEAYVYHKRRTSLKKYFRQVFRFGAARIAINQLHPGQLKITHLFPLFVSLFLLSSILGTLLNFVPSMVGLICCTVYFLIILALSTARSKSIGVGLMSVITTLYMFLGYASGMVVNAAAVYLLGREEGISL